MNDTVLITDILTDDEFFQRAIDWVSRMVVTQVNPIYIASEELVTPEYISQKIVVSTEPMKRAPLRSKSGKVLPRKSKRGPYWWKHRWGKRDICPITQTVFRSNKNIVSTRCGHSFMAYGFVKWYLQHTQCPYCRTNLYNGDYSFSKPFTV